MHRAGIGCSISAAYPAPNQEKHNARQCVLAANPAAAVDASIHDAFITSEATRIEAERNAVWPGVKGLTHWSGMDLSQRVALLKAPFDEIYEVEYPELSW